MQVCTERKHQQSRLFQDARFSMNDNSLEELFSVIWSLHIAKWPSSYERKYLKFTESPAIASYYALLMDWDMVVLVLVLKTKLLQYLGLNYCWTFVFNHNSVESVGFGENFCHQHFWKRGSKGKRKKNLPTSTFKDHWLTYYITFHIISWPGAARQPYNPLKSQNTVRVQSCYSM